MILDLVIWSALFAWVYLTFAHGNFWRATERFAPPPLDLPAPSIVAVIPARNEAQTIGAALSSHLRSTYPGEFSIVAVDDQSTDDTHARLYETIEKPRPATLPTRAVKIVCGTSPSSGWSGKLWALRQGLDAAEEIASEAKYVLFVDADIMLAPTALSGLAAKAEREDLALTSLMARLDARGWGALLIPAFIYFFQKLYPFPRVNDPMNSMAGAAGGCMLVRKDALDAIGGVDRIRSSLIDDCALARAIKDLTPSTKIWLGLADEEAVSLRDNRDLPSIWNMVARTAYSQLQHSPLLLLGTVIGMALLYLAPPLIALTWSWHGEERAVLTALTAWGLMALTYLPTLRLYGRPPWESIALPVAATLYTAMTISSAERHWRGRGGQWKGRTYSNAQ